MSVTKPKNACVGIAINHSKFILVLILFLSGIISFHSVYAQVTMNGTIFGTDTANVTVNQPIIVDSVQLDNNGITTRATSSDDMHTYSFNRINSLNPYSVYWNAISSSEIDFNIATLGLTDARTTTTSPQLTAVKIDSSNNAFAWDSIAGINTILINAGQLVQEFFTPPSTGSASIGGGGTLPTCQTNPSLCTPQCQYGSNPDGSCVTNPNQQCLYGNNPDGSCIAGPINNINQIKFTPTFDILSLGQIKDESIGVTWQTATNLIIEKVTQNPTTVFGITLNPTPPYNLTGSYTGSSSGLIKYTFTVPSNYCSDTISANCLDPNSQSVAIPVDILTNLDGIESKTTINLQFTILKNTNETWGLIGVILFISAVIAIGLKIKTKKKRNYNSLDPIKSKKGQKLSGEKSSAKNQHLESIRESKEPLSKKITKIMMKLKTKSKQNEQKLSKSIFKENKPSIGERITKSLRKLKTKKNRQSSLKK